MIMILFLVRKEYLNIKTGVKTSLSQDDIDIHIVRAR